MAEKTSPNVAGQPVGHPGGLFVHLATLAQQLRAKDWPAAFSTLVEVLGLIADDFNAVPPLQPNAAFATGPGDAVEAVAGRLESLARPHAGAHAAGAQAAGAGAVPWGELIPLLMQVLQLIFRRG